MDILPNYFSRKLLSRRRDQRDLVKRQLRPLGTIEANSINISLTIWTSLRVTLIRKLDLNLLLAAQMKILLIATDLYAAMGGGQIVFRTIIEETPEVQFFYFLDSERPDAPRPANAVAIPLLPRRDLAVIAPPPVPHYQLHAVHEADQYARSVAGLSFDLVDIPDYKTCGGSLRSAFEHHDVSVKRIVLALHGNISTSIRLNWGQDDIPTGKLPRAPRLK